MGSRGTFLRGAIGRKKREAASAAARIASVERSLAHIYSTIYKEILARDVLSRLYKKQIIEAMSSGFPIVASGMSCS